MTRGRFRRPLRTVEQACAHWLAASPFARIVAYGSGDAVAYMPVTAYVDTPEGRKSASRLLCGGRPLVAIYRPRNAASFDSMTRLSDAEYGRLLASMP